MRLKNKKVTVMISDDMLKKFTKKCNETGLSKSEILRRCISNFIRKG